MAVAAGVLAGALTAGSLAQQVAAGLAVAVLVVAACVVTARPMVRELRRLRRRDRAVARFADVACASAAVEEALAAGVQEVVADAALVGLHPTAPTASRPGLEGVVVADALATGRPATVPDGTTGRETERLLALPAQTGGRTVAAVVLRVREVSDEDLSDLQHLLARVAPALPGARSGSPPPPPPPPARIGTPATPSVDPVPSAPPRAPAPEARALPSPDGASQGTHPPSSDESTSERGLHELVARGAHDLRTPLNTLTGMVETLVRHRDELSSAQRDELHAALQRATRRIAGWVTALLDAAVDEEPEPSHVESCRLQPLLEEAVLVSSAATAGLEVYVAPTDLEVDADPGGVVRVVGNLLTNAGHHARAGDTVEVEARPRGDQVEVCVRDHGVGWDGRSPAGGGQARSSTSHHTGLGLGLASVRAHVAAWGGQLELDETPGGGATVRFTLPRGSRTAQSAEAGPDLRWTIAGRESHVRGGVHRTP